MRKIVYTLILLAVLIMVAFISLGYVSSYIGFQGYHKDSYRRFSKTIEESTQRGIFVKEIQFLINSDKVFIEKGYKWGDSSSDETMKFRTR